MRNYLTRKCAFLSNRSRRCQVVVVVALVMLMLTLAQLLLFADTFPQSDVIRYDVDEVTRWYRRSRCRGMEKVFVGDQPFFPPCRAGIPPGTPTWGRYPYLGPFQYVNSSKNPCWWEEGLLTCVPFFFLIGVSKSGTSDIYARITAHPHVQRTVKEPHFFDRKRYQRPPPTLKGHPTSVTFQAYTLYYNEFAAEVLRDIHIDGKSLKICGDASPSQFFENNEWPSYSGNEGCTEPRVILAHHLRHLNPDVKVILSIRHPVDRLYSRYLFDNQRRKKPPPASPEEFHNYVTDGLRKYRDCFNRWSVRHCVYNKSLSLSVHKLRIQESIYPVFVADWLRVMPRHQIHIVRFEDYKHNTTRELISIYQFLALDTQRATINIEQIVSEEIRNQGELKGVIDPMLRETEQLLEDFYQPFNILLAKMLKDDKFLWKDLKHGT